MGRVFLGYEPVLRGVTRACCVRGDMNCDGVLNNFDIDLFVTALLNPEQYAAQLPNSSPPHGEINVDGLLRNFDIDPFVNCVVNLDWPPTPESGD